MPDRPSESGRKSRRRPVLLTALALVLAVAAFALYLFQPWKAFTSTTVDEALPTGLPATAGASAVPQQQQQQSQSQSSAASSPSAAAAVPVDLARGSFVSGEHDTSGTARLVRLPDGATVLRLENLRTSEGPDVRVYLSTGSAAESRADVLGDGAVELDRLKGNLGNQNYTVPAGTDLSRIRSVVIWCKRFSVTFGAADLAAARS
ncbi:DM13 domain-containing protein [Kitasatospora sp. NPDC127111]|uniref:DM13 domain-containing protein n=1 Tax=Kitasatospora sp. NPDC127111 TaxID=3345363 RepID=UPI0036379C96